MAQLQIPRESFTGRCVHQQFIGLCTAPLKSHNGTKSTLKFTLLKALDEVVVAVVQSLLQAMTHIALL